MRHRVVASILAVFASSSALSPASVPAQFIASGPDFQIDSFTTRDQEDPSIAALSDGRFVVVWQGYRPDSASADTLVRLYAADGSPASTEFVVENLTTEFTSYASVAADPNGGFLVSWRSHDIRAQRFDATATEIGTEFVVNTTTTDDQIWSEAAYDSAGRFLVVWTDESGGTRDIRARMFDSAGSPLGPDFQVNAYVTGDQQLPDVTAAAGGFVVVWQSEGQPASPIARLVDTTGTPAGTEFGLQSSGGPVVTRVRVDGDAAGNFVAVWTELDIVARRFDALAQPLGTEFIVNTYTTGTQGGPAYFHRGQDIDVAPDGRFKVIWRGENAGEGIGVSARSFDASGNAEGSELRVRDLLGDQTYQLSIATDANGSFMAVWNESGEGFDGDSRDGSEQGVFGRHFCDDDDLSCSICPGHDVSIDDDGDGIPNGCDSCTNVDDVSEWSRARLTQTAPVFSPVPERVKRFKLRADFLFGGGPGAFAALDPLTRGARLRIEGASGGFTNDVFLPPGAPGVSRPGWKGNGAGTNWLFRDGTASTVDRITKVVLKDRSSSQPNLVRLTVKGSGGFYRVDPRYLPLRGIFVAGDQTDADAGRCGEANFALAECAYESSTTIERIDCAR